MTLGQCCPIMLGETSYNPKFEPRYNPSAAKYYQNFGELMYNPAASQKVLPFGLAGSDDYMVPGYGTPGHWSLGNMLAKAGHKGKRFLKKLFSLGLGETISSPHDTGSVVIRPIPKIWKKYGLGETVANPASQGSVLLRNALGETVANPADQGSVMLTNGLGYAVSGEDYGALGYAIGAEDYMLAETVANPASQGSVVLKNGLGYPASGSDYGALGYAIGPEDYMLGYPASGSDYGALGYAIGPEDYMLGYPASGADYGALGSASMAGNALVLGSAAASAYHGYKRHRKSYKWAAIWGLLGFFVPVITPAFAVYQGYAKPEPMRNWGWKRRNPKKKKRRNPKRKNYSKKRRNPKHKKRRAKKRRYAKRR